MRKSFDQCNGLAQGTAVTRYEWFAPDQLAKNCTKREGKLN